MWLRVLPMVGLFTLSMGCGSGENVGEEYISWADWDAMSEEEQDTWLEDHPDSEPPVAVDSDGDGLTDEEEESFGSDPLLADSDGDGLDDLLEEQNGTDPNAVDSDDDGYTDFQEVDAGTDPADSSSVIYTCGWPYNTGKSDLDALTMDDSASSGDTIGNFQAMDQCGESVSLHDFGGQKKFVLLDVSADWCGPCNSMAAWLEGEAGYGSFDSNYPGVREAIDSGEMYWVTVIDGTKSEVNNWRNKYPHSEIPVLHDKNGQMATHINLNYFPSIMLLNTKMKIVSWKYDDYSKALGAASEKL